MPTASALEAKQPPTVSEVAVAASSISAADASAVALSADFNIVVVDSHHDEQGLTADAAQSNSPADPAEALKKVGEYCLKATTAAPTDGIVRVSQIVDRF
jgi:hypothetical protein